MLQFSHKSILLLALALIFPTDTRAEHARGLLVEPGAAQQKGGQLGAGQLGRGAEGDQAAGGAAAGGGGGGAQYKSNRGEIEKIVKLREEFDKNSKEETKKFKEELKESSKEFQQTLEKLKPEPMDTTILKSLTENLKKQREDLAKEGPTGGPIVESIIDSINKSSQSKLDAMQMLAKQYAPEPITPKVDDRPPSIAEKLASIIKPSLAGTNANTNAFQAAMNLQSSSSQIPKYEGKAFGPEMASTPTNASTDLTVPTVSRGIAASVVEAPSQMPTLRLFPSSLPASTEPSPSVFDSGSRGVANDSSLDSEGNSSQAPNSSRSVRRVRPRVDSSERLLGTIRETDTQ